MAAGLHVTLQLPQSDDEHAIRKHARQLGIELETMSNYRPGVHARPPTLRLPLSRHRQGSAYWEPVLLVTDPSQNGPLSGTSCVASCDFHLGLCALPTSVDAVELMAAATRSTRLWLRRVAHKPARCRARRGRARLRRDNNRRRRRRCAAPGVIYTYVSDPEATFSN